MGLLRAFGAALLLAVSLVVVGAPPSFACSCAGGDTAGYVDSADVVVLGVVTERQGPPWRPVMSSADLATYTVEVESTFKGSAAGTTYVQSPDSGASCGLDFIQLGERYVIFANHHDGGLLATLCGGTSVASDDLLAELGSAAGEPVEPAEGAASGEPPPPLGATMAMPAAFGSGLALVLLAAFLWLRQLRG